MSRPELYFVLPLALAACGAAPEGRWPSLAMRPGEVQPLVQRPAAGPVAARAPVASGNADTGDAEARLNSLERDIAALTERLAAQRAAMARATNAAAGQGPETTAGSAAQVEISRGNRLASQIGDLRDRLDALAGDIARLSVAGGDVAAITRRVGAAIVQVEALRAD